VKAGLSSQSGEHLYLVSNRINLPASAGICNTLLSRLLAQPSLHFYAESIFPQRRKDAKETPIVFPCFFAPMREKYSLLAASKSV
jgi:hypothetical protein